MVVGLMRRPGDGRIDVTGGLALLGVGKQWRLAHHSCEWFSKFPALYEYVCAWLGRAAIPGRSGVWSAVPTAWQSAHTSA